MTQSTLPLAGPHALEAELRERCPLLEIECRTELRARFDWKIAEGRQDSAVVVKAERQFWSQVRTDFIEKYDCWAAERENT
jgi:hypothetical protein